MVILAFISDPPVITKILQHLGLPTEPPPLSPARVSWEPQLSVLDSPVDDPLWDDPMVSTSGDEIPSSSPPVRLPPLETARPPP